MLEIGWFQGYNVVSVRVRGFQPRRRGQPGFHARRSPFKPSAAPMILMGAHGADAGLRTLRQAISCVATPSSAVAVISWASIASRSTA